MRTSKGSSEDKHDSAPSSFYNSPRATKTAIMTARKQKTETGTAGHTSAATTSHLVKETLLSCKVGIVPQLGKVDDLYVQSDFSEYVEGTEKEVATRRVSVAAGFMKAFKQQ